jgi:hypothetical protein
MRREACDDSKRSWQQEKLVMTARVDWAGLGHVHVVPDELGHVHLLTGEFGHFGHLHIVPGELGHLQFEFGHPSRRAR